MKKKLFILTLVVAAVFCGCTVLKQAVALKDCKYMYSRMSDVTFMDMKPAELATQSASSIGVHDTSEGDEPKSDDSRYGEFVL